MSSDPSESPGRFRGADGFPVERRYYRFVEAGEGRRRVPISAAEYDPDDPDTVAYTERSVRVRADVRMRGVQGAVDTRTPLGGEPLLSTASGYRGDPPTGNRTA